MAAPQKDGERSKNDTKYKEQEADGAAVYYDRDKPGTHAQQQEAIERQGNGVDRRRAT